MAKLEIKSCPFCGCSGYGVHIQKHFYDNADYLRWSVLCEDCGVETSEYATLERAIEAWNRRMDVTNDG